MTQALVFGIFDWLFSTLPEVFNSKSTSDEIIKVYMGERKEAIETAVLEDNSDISADMAMDCHLLGRGESRIEDYWLEKAKAGDKLVKWTIFYLTDPEAELIMLDQEEKEFVNSVAKYIAPDFGPIYPAYNTYRISKYDSKNVNHKYKGRFIVNHRDLDEKIEYFPNFITKVAAKFAKIHQPKEVEVPQEPINNPIQDSSALPGRYDENGLFYPAFTNITLEAPIIKRPEQMSDKFYNMCEMTIGQLLGNDFTYYYSFGNGCWKINIKYPSHVGTFVLDNGAIMGGDRISIMVPYTSMNGFDHTFVDVSKHPDIVQKVITSSFYALTPEELAIVRKDYFINQGIYHSIDFSNMQVMNNLNTQELHDLEYSLVAIRNIFDESEQHTRYRFSVFNGPKNFTLVSDKLTVSPLSADYTTAWELRPITYVISGDTITKTINGVSTLYTIKR